MPICIGRAKRGRCARLMCLSCRKRRWRLERVRERVSETPVGEWVIGHGWAQDLWPDRAFPTRQDLDAVAPRNPVYLDAKSGHAAWVNSLALERAGISDSAADPEGGQILRDADGAATGILLETAMDLVSACIPNPTGEQLADMMARGAGASAALWHHHDS